MGLDIFFSEDIRNALLAANEASSATAAVATGQDIRTLDRITERLRGELSEDSQVLLEALRDAAVGNVDAVRHYRHGYKAALTTVALSFGLSPALIVGQSNTLALGVQDKALEVEGRMVRKSLPVVGEASNASSSTLAGDERALVCYALEHLGGKFNTRDLAEAFKGRISQRRIEQLSRQWESLGWLVAGRTRADGKRITRRLLVVATLQQ